MSWSSRGHPRYDEHDGCCGQWFDNRRNDALSELNCRLVRLMHLHRDRFLCGGEWGAGAASGLVFGATPVIGGRSLPCA
jgi:hypothetical protein